jgi:hypothetical protein
VSSIRGTRRRQRQRIGNPCTSEIASAAMLEGAEPSVNTQRRVGDGTGGASSLMVTGICDRADRQNPRRGCISACRRRRLPEDALVELEVGVKLTEEVPEQHLLGSKLPQDRPTDRSDVRRQWLMDRSLPSLVANQISALGRFLPVWNTHSSRRYRDAKQRSTASRQRAAVGPLRTWTPPARNGRILPEADVRDGHTSPGGALRICFASSGGWSSGGRMHQIQGPALNGRYTRLTCLLLPPQRVAAKPKRRGAPLHQASNAALNARKRLRNLAHNVVVVCLMPSRES